MTQLTKQMSASVKPEKQACDLRVMHQNIRLMLEPVAEIFLAQHQWQPAEANDETTNNLMPPRNS